MNEDIIRLAHRLLDVADTYEVWDNDETVETIAAVIENNPTYIIERLLDAIEEENITI